ncbi:hypothetical protein FB45DRAFT_1032146 [Roridomyces roridus]|uniref:Uncharacterized protein n=1 Tax=Roridomyces roridus TaxID=1738132 RepID=A0AAD7BJG5_9AGAR|nr:hypothetical protein FB45DRAFT_1032146 [Roridomyces roridus]
MSFRQRTAQNLSESFPPAPPPTPISTNGAFSNAASHQLFQEGNRDQARQNYCLDEYTELFRAYVRLAAYCNDLIKLHTTIQREIAVPSLPPFDPDQPAAVELAADLMVAGLGAGWRRRDSTGVADDCKTVQQRSFDL